MLLTQVISLLVLLVFINRYFGGLFIRKVRQGQ